MTQAILVLNIKGGTGKSTIAQQLSYGMRDAGHDIGVLDADIDSANLATRFGIDERVTFEGDHEIMPVEKEGLKIYSMENAFDDASFSQTGEFMAEVVRDMILGTNWEGIDYLIVDCPPGSSDVFGELVKALRANILGAVSVSQPKAVDDTARLVKVCNHKWVPIIGFIENMRGVVADGEPVCSAVTGERIYPFGNGEIEELAGEFDGNFLGPIPLCSDIDSIEEESEETINNTVATIENATTPEIPEDNSGRINFIKNVWGAISSGISRLNSDLDIQELQDKFGVEDRDPLIIELELTDARGLGGIFSKTVLRAEEGNINVMKPSKAKRKGLEPEGGLYISSQDLHDAIKGKKEVMWSPTGEIITEEYSIISAIQMGDAEMWGEKTINRLSVLDKILSEVVPMDEVSKIMEQQS